MNLTTETRAAFGTEGLFSVQGTHLRRPDGSSELFTLVIYDGHKVLLSEEQLRNLSSLLAEAADWLLLRGRL